MDWSAVATYVGTFVGFMGVILPILIRHESRLSRIEAKLDMLLSYHGIDPPEEKRRGGNK